MKNLTTSALPSSTYLYQSQLAGWRDVVWPLNSAMERWKRNFSAKTPIETINDTKLIELRKKYWDKNRDYLRVHHYERSRSSQGYMFQEVFFWNWQSIKSFDDQLGAILNDRQIIHHLGVNNTINFRENFQKMVLLGDGSRKFSKEIILTKRKSSSSMILFQREKPTPVRAVAIFRTDNLAAIERVFVETKEGLVEMVWQPRNELWIR